LSRKPEESSEKLLRALLIAHLPTADRDFKRGSHGLRFLDFFRNLIEDLIE
jgi:hypothetical protein